MNILTDVEARVLGSLMEKELTTPQYYPLSLNALTNACNQKSNRDPVVNFDESDVIKALDGLRRKGLTGETSGAGSRVVKYRHIAPKALGLDEGETAVLCELMLRGSQTVGELRSRAGRMHDFGALEEVQKILDRLQSREPSLVTVLPRQAGHKERRYVHLLSGPPDESQYARHHPQEESGDHALAGVERELVQLREDFEALKSQFLEWKKQFE